VATPGAALISFRLGGSDGVSVEAEKWRTALGLLGFEIHHGWPDRAPSTICYRELAIGAPEPPTDAEIEDALAGRPRGGREPVVRCPSTRRRPTPWPGSCGAGGPYCTTTTCRGNESVSSHRHPPPDDPHWLHVTINDLSRRQLAERGIAATVVRNTFDVDPAGRGCATRGADIGIAADERLLLQPTRAYPRKNVAGGAGPGAGIGATFWLLGPAEAGTGRPSSSAYLATARDPVVHGPGAWPLRPVGPPKRRSASPWPTPTPPVTRWRCRRRGEGFGNPAIRVGGLRPASGPSGPIRWRASSRPRLPSSPTDDPAAPAEAGSTPPTRLCWGHMSRRRLFACGHFPVAWRRLLGRCPMDDLGRGRPQCGPDTLVRCPRARRTMPG